MALKFYTGVAKEMKLIVRKFWGLIPTFVEVTWEKLVQGAFCIPHHEPRRPEITNFSSKIFKVMRFLRSSKGSKTIFELTFTTQKANACSLLNWLFFSVVRFLVKLGLKTQNCQFKLKFGTQTNSNKQNSMMMFTFPVFNQKYPPWANLVQKFKIACSK